MILFISNLSSKDLLFVTLRILLLDSASNVAPCFDSFMLVLIRTLTSKIYYFLLGSEIYQEYLTKALAKYYVVKLLIVDTSVLARVCS